MTLMNSPLAVLISDIHYNLQTLDVADKALRMAISKANELNITLIVAGDLHDSKAVLRGECVKAIMDSLSTCRIQPIILRGNHDSINEKSTEHSLEFLRDIAQIISTPQTIEIVLEANHVVVELIPYCYNAEDVRKRLLNVPKDRLVIMHQGVTGTNMGHYFQDHSALSPKDLEGRRVISGHYHERQCMLLSNGGLLDYLGNPYTLGFGEAEHPEKGFQILYTDGTLEFVPTNLRKHIVYDLTVDQAISLQGHVVPGCNPGDKVWFKITGAHEQLAKIDKHMFNTAMHAMNFKLDLIPLHTEFNQVHKSNSLSDHELLDCLITSLENTTDERKSRLKDLWRTLVSSAGE